MEEISSLRAPFVPFNSLFTNKIYLVFLFSNFVWMFPARKATTRVTIKTLKERIVSNISVTGILVSVNAQCFTSKEFRQLCCYLRIRHVTTSNFPQASHAEHFKWNLRAALIQDIFSLTLRKIKTLHSCSQPLTLLRRNLPKPLSLKLHFLSWWLTVDQQVKD